MNAAAMTLQQFLANDIESYEFVKGELMPMSNPTVEHGIISSNVVTLLNNHVRQFQLGRVVTAETTFQIGQSGRKPDVAFISKERIPQDARQASPVPPDLAVEVVSPTDTVYDVCEKVLEYLDAGVRIVWVIEPVIKTVTVYRSRTDIKVLTLLDTLTGEDVVEGFQCSVTAIFE